MKLDQKDLIRYNKVKQPYIENQNTMKMLADQHARLSLKHQFLLGGLEAIVNEIVEKYGLENKNCQIEEDGSITEKT